MATSEPYSVDKLTAEARRLAAEYRRATGKTLPLSAEIAVNDAIRLLALELPGELNSGCDALRRDQDSQVRVQVKGRVVFGDTKGTPRIGQLKLDQSWDETVLVIMGEDYEPQEIYCATRTSIESVLEKKPSNKRGVMTLAQFKIIARREWTADDGLECHPQ
ncbi:MAG: hypothetical protein ACI9BW_003923 [Gammaproteobacteria bacterium]